MPLYGSLGFANKRIIYLISVLTLEFLTGGRVGISAEATLNISNAMQVASVDTFHASLSVSNSSTALVDDTGGCIRSNTDNRAFSFIQPQRSSTLNPRSLPVLKGLNVSKDAFSPSTATFLPSPLQVSFYHIRIQYTSTSDWAEVEFLNTERILTARVMSVDGNPTTAQYSPPFLRLNRPLDTLDTEPGVAMTLDMAITPTNLDQPIAFRSKHGAIGGSGLLVYNILEGIPTLLSEIDHYWLDPQNPDTSEANFNINLEPLTVVVPNQQLIQRSVPDRMLWAVYYPWIAWDQNASCTDHPLHPYAYNPDGSRTIETFLQAIEDAKSAGIDGFFVSWLDTPDINQNLMLILNAAQEKNFKIAVYLESTPDPNDRTVHPEMIEQWLAYAINTFGQHPAYMKVNDKPLIVVYNSSAAPLSVWQGIIEDLDGLGLHASYFGMSYEVSDLDLFEGLHQYAIFGYSNLAATYAAISKAVRYYGLLEDTQGEELIQKIFVATVQPGFNNCPYGEDPPFVVERNDGEFFRSTFEAAIGSDTNWIMITSWNEFGEDTHIEPSEKYGDRYLQITREYAKMWKRTLVLSHNDFERDFKSDIGVWRDGSGTWYVVPSSAPDDYLSVHWGMSGDLPVTGDYDRDGNTDLAVWRPDTGVWYVLPSNSPGTYTSTQWGVSSDIPVQSDYDGDGKDDIAVWRPSEGMWYILPSNSPGTYTATQWGATFDIPVPADYDGDGKTDLAVWRPSEGVWYVLPSNSPGTYTSDQWGINTDIPTPGDYDADGKTDIAVWRPSEGMWYVLPSASPGSYTSTQWGTATDTPVAGDYDGDGKSDIAVWRPDDGVWYILPSGSPGTYTATQWGTVGDEAISGLTGILRSVP
jgi:hypothetical protein